MAERKNHIIIKKGGSSSERHRVTPDQADAVATLLRQQRTDNENGTPLPNPNSGQSPISNADSNVQSQGA